MVLNVFVPKQLTSQSPRFIIVFVIKIDRETPPAAQKKEMIQRGIKGFKIIIATKLLCN